MNYSELVKLNSHLQLRDVHDGSFVPYGKIIMGYDFSDLIRFIEKETIVPELGNIYKASVPELEKFEIKYRLENEFYGEMPVQIGYCNGRNSSLNALEYHIGSEINIAVSDMVLMLGKLQDIVDNYYDAADVDVFHVRKGTALQLYETTLHFSPCKTCSDGFKCLVILPKGTNEPLSNPKSTDKLLFAKNKWLIAHPLRTQLTEKGAWPGILGDNIEIKIL